MCRFAAAERCRANELAEMAGSFTSATYASARKNFVGKKGKTGFVPCESPVPPLPLPVEQRLANNVVPASGLLFNSKKASAASMEAASAAAGTK